MITPTHKAFEPIDHGRALIRQVIDRFGQTTKAEKLALAAKLGDLGRRPPLEHLNVPVGHFKPPNSTLFGLHALIS